MGRNRTAWAAGPQVASAVAVREHQGLSGRNSHSLSRTTDAVKKSVVGARKPIGNEYIAVRVRIRYENLI
jgi:hypothetical protein